MNALYQKYQQQLRKIADLRGASALMLWDQEVFMPSNSHTIRAQQIATLTSLGHQFFSSNELRDNVKRLTQSLAPDSKAFLNVLVTQKDIDKQSKLSNAFINELSNKCSASFDAWQRAYKTSSFEIFRPHLEEIVRLKRKECEMIGYKDHPYDALLDDFDRGLTVSRIDQVFGQLKNNLKEIMPMLLSMQNEQNNFLQRKFNKDTQWDIGKKISRDLGFNFSHGRKDISTHPFTVSMASSDVRITTRINENNFMEMLWSTIHEIGHALYEQGLNHDDYGLPSGEASSISIHESQSRLYENNLAKGVPFLTHYWNLISSNFQTMFNDVDFDDFVKAVNYIKPSLIRTGADELTYHSHVIIRYEIEKMLIEGSINVRDLPKVWNEMYEDQLGIVPPDDKSGVLQDVHWSHGSFGYFPTYTMGSLYAAQFYEHIKKSTNYLDFEIEKGDFSSLKKWLQENIYSKGRLFESEQLCELATGEKLNPDYYMSYIQKKYTEIYRNVETLKII